MPDRFKFLPNPVTNVLQENLWWSSGEVQHDNLPDKSRFAFKKLSESLNNKTADLITGPRNSGKTTLIYQLISHLLKRGVKPEHIFYHSFDEKRAGLGMLLIDYERGVLRKKLSEEKVYIFLDEVHKMNDWSEKLSNIQELNPKLKLVFSSSIAVDILDKNKDGKNWYNVHRVPPLSFLEFLHLKGEKVPLVEGALKAEIFEGMIKINLQKYLRRGFPEILESQDSFAKKYVKELVLGRIVFRDIWEAFNVKDMGLVRDLSDILLSEPGSVVNVNSIASELNKARKTVRNVLDYLEYSYVVKRLQNLKGPKLAPSRKNVKIYPTHCSLSLTEDEGKMAETLVCNAIDAVGYWSGGASEVDFVARSGGRMIPLEANMNSNLSDSDMRGLKNFCRRYNIERGVVVTKDLRGRMNWADLVPLHTFLVYPEKFLNVTPRV